MGIVSRISKCAKEKGFTIAEIERKCGFGTNTMYRWDQNSPALEKVIKVANLIDISIDYLATGEDSEGGPLSQTDQDLLHWIHILNEETQRDFLGQIRLYVKQHKEDWATTDSENEDAPEKEEVAVASK